MRSLLLLTAAMPALEALLDCAVLGKGRLEREREPLLPAESPSQREVSEGFGLRRAREGFGPRSTIHTVSLVGGRRVR